MNIVFERIKAQNFLSWKNLSLNLKDCGIVGILGGNFVGKSNLFSAILVALYDKTLRGHTKSSHKTDGCNFWSIELDFQIGDTKYKVIRGDFKRELWISGIMVAHTSSGVSEYMSKILNCSFSEFVNVSYVGQNRLANLASIAGGERKSLLEPFLNLPDFKKVKNQALVWFNKYDKELAVLDERKANIHRQISGVVKSNKQDLVMFKARRAESILNLSKVTTSLNKLRGFISDLTDKEDNFNVQLQEMSAKLYSTKGRLTEIEIHIKKASASSSRCPACFTIPSKENVKDVVVYLGRSKHKLSLNIKVLKDNINTLNADLRKVANIKSTKIQVRSDLNSQIGDFTAIIRDSNQKIKSLESSVTTASLEVDLLIVSKLKQFCDSKKQSYGFWNKAFGSRGVSAYLMKDVMPKISNRISHYLNLMLPGLCIEFKYHESKMTIDIEIFDNGNIRSYSACSGAQRRLMDLSCSMALYDVGSGLSGRQSSILLLDEIFDSLDSHHLEVVRDWILGLKQSTIFIISHNDIIKDWLPEVKEVRFNQNVGSYFV